MNQHQKIFEFQIVDIPNKKNNESLIPKENERKRLLDWLDEFATNNSNLGINYWIGITSEFVPSHTTWHFDKRKQNLQDLKRYCG